MKAENGPKNETFEPSSGQPVKVFGAETNGAAASATHETPKSITNGTSEPKTSVETIKAKYLLGCDGARSWTRQQLGIPLELSQMQDVSGVIDIIPLTDFRKDHTYLNARNIYLLPNLADIRRSCVLRSSTHGSILIAPRQGGLARLYIQINEMSCKGGNFARLDTTPTLILEAAQAILEPYTLDFKYFDWWSVYRVSFKPTQDPFGRSSHDQIQQRVASQFSVANRYVASHTRDSCLLTRLGYSLLESAFIPTPRSSVKG